MAQRISMYLAGLEFGQSDVTALKERWALSGFIRVDPSEREVEQTDDGYWVRAWVRIGKPGLGANKDLLRERYEAAVASLPLMTREVFDARRTEGLEDHVIAKRYGIRTREVEELVAEALQSISRVLLLDRTE
ncbi:MAG TPA: hypothetical protein VF503_19550 [Sphingobium sp.]|uniref:hypothetical protein n=1 Tax=Sphingobium sp. TaxID=1912891 RepID=UPI002ED2BDAD